MLSRRPPWELLDPYIKPEYLYTNNETERNTAGHAMSVKRVPNKENSEFDVELDFSKLLMLNGSSPSKGISAETISTMTKIGVKPDINTDL